MSSLLKNRDRWFLFRYYVESVIVLALLISAILIWNPHGVELNNVGLGIALIVVAMGGLRSIVVATICYFCYLFIFTPFELTISIIGLGLIGILIGLYSAFFMHQAAHGAVCGTALNRFVGEICALHQLVGFYGWVIPHWVHHQHPDDPFRDAHPPGDLSFIEYADAMKLTIVRCLEREYKSAFDSSEGAQKIWNATIPLLVANRLLKIVFWFLILGPYLFGTLFLTSFLTQMLFYVHFNWACHRSAPFSHHEIIDLNEGLYYRAMNFLLFDIYMHKRHHNAHPALRS